VIEQASNGTQYITTVGPFITPAKAGDTFYKFKIMSFEPFFGACQIPVLAFHKNRLHIVCHGTQIFI